MLVEQGQEEDERGTGRVIGRSQFIGSMEGVLVGSPLEGCRVIGRGISRGVARRSICWVNGKDIGSVSSVVVENMVEQ